MTQPALFSDPVRPSCILSGDGGGKDGLGNYRYALRIPLVHGLGMCLWILANPSTAVVVDGVFASDPTVTRCINYTRRWGFGECVVANARAWRETDPKKVPADPLAIGPENDRIISELASEASVVMLGYGKLGGTRGPRVIELVRSAGKTPYALKFNSDWSPCHPLYLAADLSPIRMEEA